jgi:hypothetical protein
MIRLPFALRALGALVVVASGAWWWITYGEVIRYNYISAGEASVCLVGDSDICRLARALCRGAHPVSVIAYRAAALWFGVAVLSSALVAPDRRANVKTLARVAKLLPPMARSRSARRD